MPRHNSTKVRQDFFETPQSAITPILKYINSNVQIIWEPTHGNGSISNVLIENGYTVIKSDLYPQSDDVILFDFLEDTATFHFDCIIFNPPFCLKTQFLERICKEYMNKQFIFICPLTVMETPRRSILFDNYNLSIVNLSNRVQYSQQKDTDKKSSVAFQSIWVINNHLRSIHFERNV